jgi:hypothetical protein
LASALVGVVCALIETLTKKVTNRVKISFLILITSHRM